MNNSPERKKILVWERDEPTRDLVIAYLAEHGHKAILAEDHEAFERSLEELRPAIALVEFPNLYLTTEEELTAVASRHPATAFVAVLDSRRCNRVVHLVDEGVSDCLVKPVDEESLHASLERAIVHHERRLAEAAVRRRPLRRLLGLVGWDLPTNGMDRTRIRPRFWIVLAGLVILLLGGSFGFLEYSTSPTFCNSCHIMKPFVTAWETSTHKDVGCVDCHYPPGEYWKTKFQAVSQVVNWVTGTYSTKPYAEINDENCLSCHTTRLLRGQVVFKRGIKFDHVPHLKDLARGKKLKCTTCHSQIVQGEHVTVNERVCFICHFMGQVEGIEPKSQEFCTHCHQPPEDDIELAGITYNHKDFVSNGVACQRCHLEAVKGDGKVPRHTCTTCHGEPERIARYDETEFMHKTHVTEHKVECDQCHEEIVHSVRTQTTPLSYDCRICHTSTHEGIKKMYMGTGGKGVDDKPNPMYLAQVDCIGCHMEESGKPDDVVDFGEKTLAPVEKGCTDCHGTDYEGLLGMWLDDVKADVEATEVLIAQAEAALEKAGGEKAPKKAVTLVEEARYNFHFVKSFHGAHNPDYSAELLSKAREYASKALEILGAQAPATEAQAGK